MRPRTIRLALRVACLPMALSTGCLLFDDDAGAADGAGDEPASVEAAATMASYQAEDNTFQKGCSVRANHAGYTGSGFMDYGGDGSIVEWGRVNVAAAGRYTLSFRYANGSGGDRRSLVTVNDTVRAGQVAFSPTGAWTRWDTTSITVSLSAGRNKIRVTADGATGGPNLDRMDVVSEDGPAGGGSVCAAAGESERLTLSCPPGAVIERVDLASYGVPQGSCSNDLSIGSCHASSSLQVVEDRCLNQGACIIDVNNGTFGDPCPGTPKSLSVVFSCAPNDGGGSGPGDAMPVFLLAGQSNMEGNVNSQLFRDLLDELEAPPRATRQRRIEDRLRVWYLDENDGYARYGFSEEMVSFEASELLRLEAAGLAGRSTTQPYDRVWCSFNDSPVQPLAVNCGRPFGPELGLGRYLGATDYAPTSLVKVARGGTTLDGDWLSPTAAARRGTSVGAQYEALKERIRALETTPESVHPGCASADCEWAALVWFQGENDSFDRRNGERYRQNLTDFLADVRAEVGDPDLPVVVVQIGAWAQSMSFGDLVAEAQEAVAAADRRTALVATDDLSGFYHYDPVAQLVIGERIARRLVGLLADDRPPTADGGACAAAREGEPLTLSCPAGEVIERVDLASYGVPQGSCSNDLSIGECHASTSLPVVEDRCLQQRSCTVDANNATFGDPCPGTAKSLAVVYRCASNDGDGDGDGDVEIVERHIGGYQNGVTSGGFVPAQYDGGFSMYVAAWQLFDRAPDAKTQTGLFGTWMHGRDPENPPLEKMYSDIEGGLGWWRNTRFATATPKFIMGGVALNFSAIANGPGAGAGNWDEPRGLYGVAQLSPWLLFPPDGLNLRQGASGELLGYGYLPLPLTDPKTVTAGRNVATGNHCWTLFFNAKNFKGPAAFFLPYFFSRPAVDNPALSGMFLDSMPARSGGQIAMETQYTPAAQATAPDGRLYARVAPLLFPREANGNSVLVHDLFYYRKNVLWDEVASWFRGGPPSAGTVRTDGQFHRVFSRHYAGWSLWEERASGDRPVEIHWGDLRQSITDDPHTVEVVWNRSLVETVSVAGRSFNMLPEYLRFDDTARRWEPVPAGQVPDSTGLQHYRFRGPARNRAAYVTPTERTSTWKNPGPVAGPFYAYPGDGSKVTYYWYRFADQPAMLNADMTDAERERVQRRVEMLHRRWTRDRNYLAPPTIDKPLVSLDPALVVEPPAGLEIGYVPIVTRQEAVD